MARIILSREDIEMAIEAYVRDKFMAYGDLREVHVVQERKVTASITFGEDKPELTEPLPGLEPTPSNPKCCNELDV